MKFDTRSLSFLVLVILISIALLLGASHWLLGSGLNVGRWFLVVVLAYLVYRKNLLKSLLGYIGLAMIVLLVGEWVYVKANYLKLSSYTGTKEISFLSYNIFFKNRHKEAIVDIILSSDADVVALQEVTPRWHAILHGRLNRKYPYSKTHPLSGTHGICLYSKFPISSAMIINNNYGRPIAQIAELVIDNKRIEVVNTHLASPASAIEDPSNFYKNYSVNYNMRKRQLTKLQGMLDGSNISRQLILGDLNTMKIEPLYHEIRESWNDLADKKTTWTGFTFPNSSKIPSVITLDYIFYRGKVEPIIFKVDENGSSDHHGIFGKFRI